MPHISASVLFLLDAVRQNAAGEIVSVRPVCKGKNLLMDGGLDALATLAWPALFAFFGLSTTPATLRRDSGVTTISRTGNTLNASASFFEAADVGRVVVLQGDAQEMRVTGYTSGVAVTVGGVARDVSARQGTVLHVSQTGLPSEGPIARFSTLSTNSDAHGYLWDGVSGVLSTWVTRLSAEAAVDTTYKAIGWFRSSTGANLSGVANINGGVGDTLLAGEMYRVRLQLNRKIGPLTPVAKVAPITGWAADTTEQVERVALKVWSAAGAISSPSGEELEPSVAPSCSAYTQALALRVPTMAFVESPTGLIKLNFSTVAAGYANGSFTRQFVATLTSADANSAAWRTFSLGYNACAFRVLLSANCAKTTDDSLVLTFEKSWGRDLSEFA